MPLNRSKHSKVPGLDSEEDQDQRRPDAMSMARQRTREVYEAREIEQQAPTRQEKSEENARSIAETQARIAKRSKKENAKALQQFQQGLRPIRSRQQ